MTFLNNDDMQIEAPDPTYYPATGWAKQLLTFDGNLSQEFDLSIFPWDLDNYSLMIVANMESGGNQAVRLFWQSGRNIIDSTPLFLDNQLTEYDLVEEFNTLVRLPSLTNGDSMWGPYNTVQFQFFLKRNATFYMVKICMIVFFLNVISWVGVSVLLF